MAVDVDSDVGEDVPRVGLEEMLKDMTLSDSRTDN